VAEIITTDEFAEWYGTLAQKDVLAVGRIVDLLALEGTSLGFPYSSAIKGSEDALRELRIRSSGHPLRVFYAFDRRRDAVLILGGDKTGDGKFYERMIPVCHRIWTEYLAEQASGQHKE
jgi:hypothetical protein